MTMHTLDPMGGTLPREIMPLHHPGRPTTFADTNHINVRDILKRADGQRLPDLAAMIFAVYPKLLNKLLRLTTGLRHQLNSGRGTIFLPPASNRRNLPPLGIVEESNVATINRRRPVS